MKNARILIIVLGLLLPYAARLPRGMEWLQDYTSGGIGGFLLIGLFNALAWGSILASSFAYNRPLSILFPAVPGFAFLFWSHYSLDLRSDAQAAIALAFIPVYALLPIALGAGLGLLVDRRLKRG